MIITLQRLGVAAAVLCVLPIAANAQDRPSEIGSFEDIVVTARPARDDPSTMAGDAEFLMHTAGDGNDPLKAVLALPGITFGAGDMDRPVMRGAGPANNLFLVDDIPLPDLFHDLSDSIVSSNVLHGFNLHSAALPNRYGGATGGVIDIRLRDPQREGARLSVDLSQLKSGALVETAITDTLGAYASYRVNLAHLFLRNYARGNALLEFRMPQSRDYTAKAVWRMGDASISATILGAWDERREVQRRELGLPPHFGQTETRATDAQSLRLHVPVAEAGEWVTSIAHVRSAERTREVAGDFRRLSQSNLSLRSRVTVPLGAARIEGGVNIDRNEAVLAYKGLYPICDYLERHCGGALSIAPRRESTRFGRVETFVGALVRVGEQWSIDMGGRWLRDFALDRSYWEPRAAIEWTPSDAVALYVRGARQHERPELDRLLLIPTARSRQRYHASWQALAGMRANLAGGWRAQLEGWYKDFDVADLVDTPLAARVGGDARGLNLFLTKPAGDRFDGWLSLSRTWSKRSLHPGDAAVPYRYDIPWSGTVAATWHVTPSLSLGGKWRLQSGTRYTPLVGVAKDPVTGEVVQAYGEPFSARAALYARLDLRIEKTLTIGRIPARIYVDALNILDRANVAERHYPIANTRPQPDGSLIGVPADDSGIPRFVAVGVGFVF
ncbi:MAG: TonB-dependent receptor [Sphingopyxis sp.]|uniref:TonB-dependent receptor plug domain-containing protein n=1 Tax=Sphingopyxis sp. TaxID=1908224 RepID=UPI002AB7FCD6|nr:TonB-dependent receptor [Sphingopyxis sp.]MDZ3833316.1 TonB-dependent receptor [Sphingopyxis sp.]